jgi:hypothetical protein
LTVEKDINNQKSYELLTYHQITRADSASGKHRSGEWRSKKH